MHQIEFFAGGRLIINAGLNTLESEKQPRRLLEYGKIRR